jgi:hypothetical protein
MAISTLFWRPVNLFRSRETRARSKHTSIWGLARIYKKHRYYWHDVAANIENRTLTGNLTMKQASKLPSLYVGRCDTHWETVALYLAALPKEKYDSRKDSFGYPKGGKIASHAREVLYEHSKNKDKIMERLKRINIGLYYALEERTSGGQPDQPLH